jgi:hypothetical protein
VWADTIDLAIGRWQLGVRVDTPATAERLRALLAPYLSSGGEALPSNFSIRTPSGRLRKKPGALYRGGHAVVESTDLGHLVVELVRRLSDLQFTTLPIVDVDARVFRLGDRAVVTDVLHPALTNHSAMVGTGIEETTTFTAWIDTASGEVVTPASLPGLDWAAADLSAVTWPSSRTAIHRVLSINGSPDRADLGILWARANHDREIWLELLRRLQVDGRVSTLPPEWDEMHTALVAVFRDVLRTRPLDHRRPIRHRTS